MSDQRVSGPETEAENEGVNPSRAPAEGGRDEVNEAVAGQENTDASAEGDS